MEDMTIRLAKERLTDARERAAEDRMARLAAHREARPSLLRRIRGERS